ncbi:MAG: transporter substrate-binding domain-containing protein [Gammaproteobacteria bacterium]
MKKIISCIIALIAPLALAAHAAAEQSVIDDITDRGKLRVGLSSFVPWAMRDKDGAFVGFEPDVAAKLAEDMGVELEIVPTAWDGIIPSLLAGKFDLIVSGMSVKPARNLQVNFTIPYQRHGMDLFASKQIASGMSSLEDFNKPEIVFALRRGSTPVEFVQKHLPKAQIRQFDDEATARLDVVNGRSHAMAAMSPQPAHSVADFPDKLYRPLAGKTLTREPAAMALRKGDPDALNFLNNWITLHTENGWLQSRYNYWFGTRDWASLIADK